MKNKSGLLLNQSGIGIVGVMIAATMVVVIALVVGNFISDQAQQSVKLEISGSCQNIANSVVEYIKKDESSLFITSYGPQLGSTKFASGLDKTEDGLDRFVFKGQSVPLFTGPAGYTMTLPPGAQKIPANWKYFNYLNVKNSTNRLITLAADGEFCCSSLDMNNPNCGARFMDDALTRPGLRLSEKNVDVDLAINFKNPNGSTMCVGRSLSLNNLPSANYNQPVDFKVKVTMKGAGGDKTCTASGTVAHTVDVTPSIAMLQMEDQSLLCPAGKTGLPSHCSSATPVKFKIKTVKNSGGTNCQALCLGQIKSKTCGALEPLNLFNPQTTCPTTCLNSEPGSSFLCRIGEKNWFHNPLYANRWEPCEVAKVYDYNDSVAGSVRIQYEPEFNGSRSEVTTNATLILSGLTQGRAYVVDVRAVDTRGNVGPSFCQYSPSCTQTSAPHFVVMPPAPALGTLSETANQVGTVSMTTQLGRDNSLTSLPQYANALNILGNNKYQCQAGSPVFSVPISYSVPAGAFSGFITTSCTATVTNPSGTTNIPRGFKSTKSNLCNSIFYGK